MKKSELLSYLDSYLEPKKFTDSSKNGLQVDSSKAEIVKIAYAVDATSYLISKAAQTGADLLLVHHGMFWWFESTITGPLYERVSLLLRNDMALYGMHLPLDAHPAVGNNIGIIRAFADFFGIPNPKVEPFGEYHGEVIGFWIRLDSAIEIARLREFSDSMGFVFDFQNFGNLRVFKSLCVVSGGGGEAVKEAHSKGYDVFLTGEGVHYQYTLAKELSQSVLFWGHYETETVGVSLLAKHLSEKFGIETVFVDEKYGRSE